MNPSTADIKVRESVKKELEAMVSIGIFVPKRATELAERIFIADYVGMGTSEIADFLVDIAYLESRRSTNNGEVKA